MATCSSYEKLTQLSTSTPARATDLIVFLIQSLAREVCDSIRGAQTQYCIVSRARDICNRINELVEAAERNKDWADYGSWTAQIGPLEERLLDLSKLVESEGEAAYSSLSPKSISECLSHIKCWKENRKISRDVAQMLHTPPFELPSYAWDSELKAAAQEDHLSWVSVVCEALTEALSPLAPGFQEKPKQYAHIIEVVRLLAEIQTGLGLNAEIVEVHFLLPNVMDSLAKD
ncbi:hypothetical protein FRC02_006247 [Tulasnella sp. 418]|nr:hypothetical protein FRC02_006247 [Tulasnella sp. 418]